MKVSQMRLESSSRLELVGVEFKEDGSGSETNEGQVGNQKLNDHELR